MLACFLKKSSFQEVFVCLFVCLLFVSSILSPWATVHGVTKSRTRLSDFTFHFNRTKPGREVSKETLKTLHCCLLFGLSPSKLLLYFPLKI